MILTRQKKRRSKPANAPRAETWEDVPHRRRPTAERMKYGTWRTMDTQVAGYSVAYDAEAHPLDRLAARGRITQDQRDAGFSAAELFAANTFTSQGRSCLDFSPVSTGDDDTPGNEASYARYCTLWGRLGHYRAAAIRHTCLRGEEPSKGQLPVLLEALAICEAFFIGRGN